MPTWTASPQIRATGASSSSNRTLKATGGDASSAAPRETDSDACCATQNRIIQRNGTRVFADRHAGLDPGTIQVHRPRQETDSTRCNPRTIITTKNYRRGGDRRPAASSTGHRRPALIALDNKNGKKNRVMRNERLLTSSRKRKECSFYLSAQMPARRRRTGRPLPCLKTAHSFGFRLADFNHRVRPLHCDAAPPPATDPSSHTCVRRRRGSGVQGGGASKTARGKCLNTTPTSK